MIIESQQSPQPVYLDSKSFYVRTNPATEKLEGPVLVDYIHNHFSTQYG